MLVKKLIDGALRLNNIIATNETGREQERVDALSSLNDLLGSLNVKGLVIPYLQRKQYTAIGSLLTIDSPAPISIEGAFIRDVGGSDYPLNRLSLNEYVNTSNKLSVSRPTGYLPQTYNKKMEIRFNAIADPNDTLNLMCRMPLETIPEEGINWDTAEIDLDWGYARMLRYNLAVEIAPEFGIKIDQLVYKIAQDSLDEIRIENYVPQTQEADSGIIRNYLGDECKSYLFH